MDVEILFRIAAIGILVTVICQVLNRAGREDIATMAALSGLAAVLIIVVNMLSELFASIKTLFEL